MDITLRFNHFIDVINTSVPTISNIFSSETAWPIKVKFYVEPPSEREQKFI